ncbi:MAG: hypothetical protein ACRDWG_04345 [Actinomycetes bacterium]|nr:hypothetical protein [Actinomycetes bacterium]
MSKHNASIRRPIPLTIAAVIVGLQGTGLMAAGFYLIESGLFGSPDSVSVAVTTGLLALAGGLALLAVAYGLIKIRVWSRSPAILWQLLTIGVGWYQLQAGLGELGIPLIVIAATTVVLLLTPSATNALERRTAGHLPEAGNG